MQTVMFAEAGKPIRRFSVRMISGNEEGILADVEDRLPFTRKIQRHIEKVREKGDGTKVIEYPLETIDHTYDFTSDMKDDAVRAYNLAKSTKTHHSDITRKNLVIEDLGTVNPGNVQQTQNANANPNRRSGGKSELVTV